MFPKPNVFISACIEYDHCRYDGTMIGSEHISKLKPYINELRVCPEMAIGFKAPRESLRLIQRKNEDLKFVQTSSGNDYTKEMVDFSDKYLSSLVDMDGFIMKAKSPSCGVTDVKVYHDIGKAHTKLSKQSGVFGGKVLELYPATPIESERRLSNFSIRENFYISIFTLAGFRELKKDFEYKKLVEFHSNNKYLFMTYKQTTLKKMGNVVANHDKKPHQAVLRLYEELLRELLMGTSSMKNRINVLTHIYGYFKKDIITQEKEFYFELLDQYLNHQIPYRAVLNILNSWSIRFKEDYLLKQTIFVPYPKDLVTVTDSGKAM